MDTNKPENHQICAREELLRLNAVLSRAGLCSRREADRLIEAGRVLVDNTVGTPGMRVAAGQEVRVDGVPIDRDSREQVILAVNKPVGYVCTTDRRWGDLLLQDLVNSPVRVFPMGRLDKDSEGLILMTNQGKLINQVMRARNFHEKEYEVTVDRKVTPAFLKTMGEGVFLPELDVTTRPCRVEQIASYRFRIVLTQGLNRQIRRMCVTLGYHVRKLKRVRIMNVQLGDLPVGSVRPLTKEEIETLYRMLKEGQDD